MNSNSMSVKRWWKRLAESRTLFILVLVTTTLGTTYLHYATPPTRQVASYLLTRHAVERILFILSVISATLAFGYSIGLATLSMIVLLMLPRVFLISPHPVDAFAEVAATALIGYILVWMSGSRQRAVWRVKTINSIITLLLQSPELEQTLRAVLDRISEAMHVKAGAVYILDEDEQRLILIAHRNLPLEVTEDINGLRSARVLARRKDLAHQLSIPLCSKDKINGLLILASSKPCPVLHREMRLLTTICNEVSVVVENARLFQNVNRQLEIQRCVCKVVEDITSELELDKVLPKVMRIAEEMVGADGGAVALWDEERSVNTYPYLHGLPQELTNLTVQEVEGISGEVMTTGNSIVLDDYQTYAKAIPAFAQAGVTSVVAVPIVNGTRTFGALSLFSLNKAITFSDRDVMILTAIGRQSGIAIENAYLYENLRFYARQITRAQESERRRISRELHDDTIQPLIVLARSLETLASSNEQRKETIAGSLRELRGLTGDLIQRVRRFSQNLRPSILDDLGLLPALKDLTAELTRQTDLQTTFQVFGPKRRLSSEVELTLFRIAQEAITNIRKHTQATAAKVTVEFFDSSVQLMVEDDGEGFIPKKLNERLVKVDGLGLTGMYERAQLIGGTFRVESVPGLGTQVIVKIPT